MTKDPSPGNAARLGGAGFDGGSCCASTWLMNQFVGTPSVAGALPTYNNANTILTGTNIDVGGIAGVAP